MAKRIIREIIKPETEKIKIPQELMPESEKKETTKDGKDSTADSPEKIVISKKKQNIQFIIFAGILILIFLAIVFVPKLIQKTKLDQNKYNNFEFVQKEDKFWYTVIQKGEQPYWIPFYYHPRDLEDIPVEANLRAKFFDLQTNNGSIYITMDPDNANNTIIIAGVEIARITGERYGLLNVPTRSAFIKQPSNSTADTGTPVVTCADANDKIMVIWITLSDKNMIYSYGDNCLILEAKTYKDMIRVADRLMYHLLGIMNT
jgi:hypothetical protein